jgi:hypothetical protein
LAFDKILAKRGIKWLVCGHAHVVDVLCVTPVFDALTEFLDGDAITALELLWMGGEFLTRLHVAEHCCSAHVEIDFPWIKHVKQQHLVLIMSEMSQRMEDIVGVVKAVADNHDESSPTELFRNMMQSN